MRAATFLAAAVLLCAGAPQARASGTEPAIGRLNHAGFSARRHCTFAAISEDTALTAAHCVAGVAPESLTLLYGYSRMTWVAEGGVKAVEPLGGDLVALCLASPPPATLPLGPPAATDDPMTIVGYGQPRVHLQQRAGCDVLAEVGGMELLLSCPSPRGTSGAPLLSADGAVVGVMSRTGRGSSMAVTVPPTVATVCKAP
ncbi:serine protease [Acuticoccus sp. MNP-M23]|uniref:trypsin-like serine peptidase n=1 Tax=Acuticoccus sp. MNP-M23 TaxID=3072793 RepID=UPI0028162339|nr:serine protease [Acuticoccus sp. MNP-M23]WMS41070.1 serine protease [Acuticoccus sp. MNP-M23]